MLHVISGFTKLLKLKADEVLAKDKDFDAIFGRVRAEDISYGSGPYSLEDRKINRRGGGRGVYFRDPNGHVLELLTVG